jgi:pectate lyase
MKTIIKVAFLFLCLVLISCVSIISDKKERESQYLNAVRMFADNVLEKGHDQWSGKNTPLLADGINIYTNEPLEYIYDGSIGVRGKGGPPNKWIMHNLANQQNLFRTFVALSNLTGDPKYKEAAEKSIRFHFDSLLDESGLFHWGSHEFIDLSTLKPIGHAWRQNLHSHELKDVYPYYDLMWEVDKEKTAKFIMAFWNAHIIDWSKLDFKCDGDYHKKMGPLWSNKYHQPEPFFEGDGLTFLSTGSDLIYAGSILYSLGGEESALTWSKRLADQYVRARNPKTGLGAYQFSKPIRHVQPPEGPLTGLLTFSDYGDRAENQFGRDFPGVAIEGWELFIGSDIYTVPALMQLDLAERLGDKGKEFADWTLSGLYTYAKYGYKTADNTFIPMWADGTDLTGYAFARTGYYGPEGHILKPSKADEIFLFTYERAVRFSRGTKCWQYFLDKDTSIVRSIWRGLGLGDPGTQNPRDINWDTDNSSPYVILALLEHHKLWRDGESLMLAKKVADNLLARSFHNGFFLMDEKSTIAEFDAIEPLALLALIAALRGEPEKVPAFSGGRNHLDLKTE